MNSENMLRFIYSVCCRLSYEICITLLSYVFSLIIMQDAATCQRRRPRSLSDVVVASKEENERTSGGSSLRTIPLTCIPTNPCNPFSSYIHVHNDYYEKHKTVKINHCKKRQPNPKIAGLRFTYKQLRGFTSEPRITDPLNLTVWNGMNVGDFVIETMILNYQPSHILKECQERVRNEMMTSASSSVA